MMKLSELMENYDTEVTETVEKVIRRRALKSFRLSDSDSEDADWKQAVEDAIEGKEAEYDGEDDPVAAADKQIHKAFMSWLEL